MNKFDNYIIWNNFKVQPKVIGKAPKKLIENIPKTELDQSYRYQFLLAQDLIKKKNLRKVLDTIGFWVEKILFKGQEKDYKILKIELVRFLKEIESNHYISSAIMVGRVLEYLSFAISKMLNIKTETSYLSNLDQLRNKFEIVNENALKFEEAKIKNDLNKQKHYKTKISQTSKDISNKLHDFVTFMDDVNFEKNKKGEKTYRYIDRLMKEILKKYRHLEGVEHVFKRINHYNYIKNLREIRNKAAHAPLDLRNNKITKEDILFMLSNFVYILEEMMALFLLIKKKNI